MKKGKFDPQNFKRLNRAEMRMLKAGEDGGGGGGLGACNDECTPNNFMCPPNMTCKGVMCYGSNGVWPTFYCLP
jgi:hypothetical protein